MCNFAVTMNTQNANLYVVILAGGVGKRLWPVSRKGLPKQFLDLFGTGETLLQTAANRARNIVGDDHILVVTAPNYAEIVTGQLPWLPEQHLLIEPVHRNTAPAAAWATHRIMNESSTDAVVTFMPADHIILHSDRFAKSLRLGAEFVSHNDTVMSMGATPTRTEPGYGYIQIAPMMKFREGDFDGDDKASATPSDMGDDMLSHGCTVGSVRSFVEKPEREFAKILIESGEFLWNTGIYMGRVGYVLEQMKQLLPVVLRHERATPEEENQFIQENYSRYPNLSLDMAILEKMPVRSVMHCDFGWADIGTWHGIYESMPKNEEDNVVVNERSHVITDNAHQNIVMLQDGRLAIIAGIDNCIVAEKDNVLLVCPKTDNSASIRRYLALVENDDNLGSEFL